MSKDYTLADNLYFGKNDTNQSFKKAVFHYEMAVKKEHVAAMYMLGICYYNGTGIEKSINDAIWYWNMAYEYGDEDHACYEMGCAYYLGEGTLQRNPVIAFKFWKLSADNGNVGSMIEVGNSYYHGDGVDKDINQSFNYWLRARRIRQKQTL